MDTQLIYKLRPQLITAEDFAPFGQVVFPTEDGKSFDIDDAQLYLAGGIPRFYIMQLHYHGLKFEQITRHQRCTQCLGSLDGKEWLMAVAQPSATEWPDWENITAFRIPGNCFIKLAIGTWHAGPFFESPRVDFYNLELSDTNLIDHHTCNLKESFGVEFEFV
jgi:ureidoglycolate hydrolase